MAQKKPSKILFCRYRHPLVEELAEFYSSKLTDARKAVMLHNDAVSPDTGDFDDEFYFLNTTIAGETHIITQAGQRDYPTNDPAIVAKLEAYLAGHEQGQRQPGLAKKRAIFKPHEQAIEPTRLKEQTFVVAPVADELMATKVISELRFIYGDKVAAKYLYNKKLHNVWSASWYLTPEQLKAAIEQIINS